MCSEDLYVPGLRAGSEDVRMNRTASVLPGCNVQRGCRQIYLRCCSVAQSCPALWDPTDCSTPGFPVLHHLTKFAQTHVHWVSDAIQPAHPLSLLMQLMLQRGEMSQGTMWAHRRDSGPAQAHPGKLPRRSDFFSSTPKFGEWVEINNPWVRKIPGVGNGNPLQYSRLGNPTDIGVW